MPRCRIRTRRSTRYFSGRDLPTDLDAEAPTLIRQRGEETAGDGPADLATRFDISRQRLAERLAAEPAERTVRVLDSAVMTLDEYLVTRLVEMVVHLDDLAVSLEVPTPEVPDAAAELVVVTLTRIARHRHGNVPLVRALSRTERVRVPVSAF